MTEFSWSMIWLLPPEMIDPPAEDCTVLFVPEAMKEPASMKIELPSPYSVLSVHDPLEHTNRQNDADNRLVDHIRDTLDPRD